MKKCSVEGCESKHYAKGYCRKHYDNLRTNGNPLIGKTIEKHGMTETPEYESWSAIKKRCLYQKDISYKNYGGRGITVCDEWKDSFLSFYEDMGPRPTDKHSIDRIDNDKGYSKENCRWADKTTQSRNTRVSKKNKSGCKGVVWNEREKKWRVRISIGKGERKDLGQYKNLEQAIEARKKAEIKYW